MNSLEEPRGQLDMSSFQIKEVLFRLKISKMKVEDWIILQRSRFDITIDEEPYSALQVFFNSQNGAYIIRVWGKTHSKGKIMKSVTEFELLCNKIFGEGLACCPGQVGDEVAESLVPVDYPFQRRVSLACAVFHLPQGPDNDHVPIDICSQCTSESKDNIEIKEEASESSDTYISLLKEPSTFHSKVEMKETTLRDTEDLNEDHDNVLSLPPTQSNENKSNVSAQVKTDKQIVGKEKNVENMTKQAPRKRKIILLKPPEDSKTDCEHCGKSLINDEVNISLDLHYKECPVAQEKIRHQILSLYSEPKEPKRANQKASVVCQVCGKELRKGSMSMHMHRHKSPLRCYYASCGTSFTTIEAQREHVKSVHLRIPHFYCETCGKLCVGKNRLKYHVQVVHKRMSLDIKCTECDEVFINHRAMLSHRNLVHFPDKFKCHDCERSFGSSQNLQKHKIVHSGERNFQCEECGQKFKKRQDVKDHRRSHTGEKPFACQHCPYRGASSSLLYHHKKQKHKAEFEEEKKQKENAKIKVSDNMPSGNNEGAGIKSK